MRHFGLAVTKYSRRLLDYDIPPAINCSYVILLLLLYIFVSVHTPISLVAGATHDDGLFITLGRYISEGQWLGPFSQFTLMKGPGYSAFLALGNWLGISASLARALFHCFAVVFFVWVANRFIQSFVLSGLLLTLLLWHPFYFCLLRIIRESIYYAQTLVVFAAAACTLFCVGERRQRLLFAAFGGGALGWFWLTREEGIWILPSVVIMVGAALFHASRERFRELVICLATSIAVFCTTQAAFRTINWWVYGKFVGVDMKEANFQRALGALHSVRSGGTKPHVSITKEAMARVYDVSPSFESLAPYFEGVGKNWEVFGCNIYPNTCGEIAAGWFMWALRDAVQSSSQYDTPQAASGFFGRLADEIESACSSGSIQCSQQLVSDMPPWTWQQLGTGLGKRLFSSVTNLLLIRPSPHSCTTINYSTGDEELLDTSLHFLGFPEAMPSTELPSSVSPYLLKGWFYKSGDEWFSGEIQKPDGSAGEMQVSRKKSPDLVQYFHDPLASHQRFFLRTRCSPECELLFISLQGDKVSRPLGNFSKTSVPVDIPLGSGVIHIDTVATDTTYHPTMADQIASHVRIFVLINYNKVLVPFILLGLISYISVSGRMHKTHEWNVCYILATAAWIAVLSRVVLLILIDSTSFPAINFIYMSPAYALLTSAGAFSIAAWADYRPTTPQL